MVSTRSTNAAGLFRASASASDHATRVFAALTLPIPNAVRDVHESAHVK